MIAEKLTVSEVDVLRLIARGFSNSDIAERLHLSEDTVRSHVSSILSELDVSDRTPAVIIDIRHGLEGQGPALPREPNVRHISQVAHSRARRQARAYLARPWRSSVMRG
ncbi:MAG: LuxR C-terminal-related transcriptional regulator [Anaerolineales bacterium]|jgi:DNA-binding CsgD family transcriptional regulator